MIFVKSLWTDLIEKRLWPVAVALLLALGAVPVLLGGSSDAVVAPVGATGATGAAAQTAQVALEPGAPQRRDRPGKLSDPFEQDEAPAVADTAGASVTAVAAAGATGARPGAASDGASGAASGASGANGAGSTAPASAPSGKDEPEPAQSAAPEADPRDAYVAVVRLGVSGSKRPLKRIARLSPLPSADNPALVYLGVSKADDSAVLLLSQDVKASGDGVCRPSKASCESIELAPGDEALLEVTGAGGATRTYQFDLVRIEKG